MGLDRSGRTLAARTTAEVEAAAAAIRARGDAAQALTLDVTDVAATRAAFDAAPPFHILVNNAGIAAAAPIHRTELPQWQQIMDLNLTGPFLAIRAIVKPMTKADYGRIINVASTAGLTGYAYCAAYCAAKHGLIGLTRALARELAQTNVTVNAVCPGYTDTEIVSEAIGNIVAKTGRTQEEALRELTAHNPQGRLIRPDEVAEAVGWLCLPSSGSINGQSVVVAGGELM